MTSQSAIAIFQNLTSAGQAFEKNEAGAREALIDHSRALIAALEIPSEFMQRTFWAEVTMILSFFPQTVAVLLLIMHHHSSPLRPLSFALAWMSDYSSI